MELLNAWIESLFTIRWEHVPTAVLAVIAGIVGFVVFYFIGKRSKKKLDDPLEKWLDKKYDGHD